MDTVRTIVLLSIAVISQAVGNVFLSKGMKQIAGPDPAPAGQWGSLLLEAAVNPTVLLGAALFVVFFALWTTALSRADLSFVLPAISFEVVLNVAFAHWFLEETISPARWAGALLISIGVMLVIWSGARTFDRPAARAARLDEARG